MLINAVGPATFYKTRPGLKQLHIDPHYFSGIIGIVTSYRNFGWFPAEISKMSFYIERNAVMNIFLCGNCIKNNYVLFISKE